MSVELSFAELILLSTNTAQCIRAGIDFEGQVELHKKLVAAYTGMGDREIKEGIIELALMSPELAAAWIEVFTPKQ